MKVLNYTGVTMIPVNEAGRPLAGAVAIPSVVAGGDVPKSVVTAPAEAELTLTGRVVTVRQTKSVAIAGLPDPQDGVVYVVPRDVFGTAVSLGRTDVLRALTHGSADSPTIVRMNGQVGAGVVSLQRHNGVEAEFEVETTAVTV
jgi:hypothetical protein